MQYELFYLVGERQESKIEEIKKGVSSILTSAKAVLLEPELSEKRRLAYEIKHQNKGIYITRRFELPEADESDKKSEFGIEAITKKLNLFSDVLRFIIVKTEDLPDLGAKERRKAQEMGAQKQSSARPQQRPGKPAYKKEAVKEQPKSEPAAKEEVKNIDEQLDKLLDI